ncbi:MAG: leucine-rich repeat protein [Erysipelotrichales bacterium]|nr:leucine-rich repeat protein [Erysipelotrichales bacterium]
MKVKNLKYNIDLEITDFSKADFKGELGESDSVLISSEDNYYKVKYRDFFRTDVSFIPDRNQIAYMTLDKLPISVTHSELESNVINHQGIGILTFKSNNFENISLANNENLYWVWFPEGMTALTGKAFQNCINLESVHLPNTITKFTGNDTFDNCQSLRHLTLPKNLVSTGGYTFRNCNSLEEMYLPDTLTNLPMMTGLKSLRFIKFPDNSSFTKVGELSNCISIEKIYLPSKVDTINSSAFSGCTNLKEINLNNVKYIGAGAFNNCTSLKEIIIPATQELLGQDIVSRCKLERLTIKATKPQFHQFSFSGTTTRYLDYYGEYLPSECTLPLSEAETIILRNTKNVLCTQEGLYNLDAQITTVYGWLKIYVPKTLVEGYKESYPRLADCFYGLTY